MKRSCIVILCLVGLIVPVQSLAQSASISGIVQDQSGAAMPNALVMLRKGAETRTTQTSAAGAFSFEKVSAGTYDLQVEHEGFKAAGTRVTVANRSPRPIEFKLQIANLQQEIRVAADAIQRKTHTNIKRK